jgi:hypothetical protein
MREPIDDLLNEALKTYGDPSPDSGSGSSLEARTLARLEEFRTITDAPARRRTRLWFAIAAPAAACVLVAVLASFGILDGRPHPPSRTPDVARSDSGGARVPMPRETQTPRHVRTPVRHPAPRISPRQLASAAPRPALPKLAVFPTLPPLTPEERAVLEWQKHAPESARQAVVQPAPEPSHDIAGIYIAPLETPALGSE